MSLRFETAPRPIPRETAREPAATPAASTPLSPPHPATNGRSFADLLHGLGRELNRGEGVLGHALSADPGRLDAGGLIALQAGIYRYTEAVELASRLVDKATNCVRTVLQSPGH